MHAPVGALIIKMYIIFFHAPVSSQISSSRVTCTTGAAPAPLVVRSLALIVDDARRTLSDPYEYTPDPTIRSVFLSSLTTISIYLYIFSVVINELMFFFHIFVTVLSFYVSIFNNLTFYLILSFYLYIHIYLGT